MKVTHLDLFSGIGGFALAAEWAGVETIGFVEIDKYCQKVLRKHWPDVPIVEDIRDVKRIKENVTNATSQRCLSRSSDWQRRYIQANEGIATQDKPQGKRWVSGTSEISSNGGTDKRIPSEQSPTILITAGFPCQPFSVAGKQLSQGDDRYLWPQTIAVIEAVKPKWVLLENVTGIINLALDTVLSDLEGAGYSHETLIIPACAVNAWHRRDRIWIVANIGDSGCWQLLQQKQKRGGLSPSNFRGNGKVQSLANSRGTKSGRLSGKQWQENTEIGSSSQDVADTTNGGAQRSGSQCDVRRLQDEVLRPSGDTDYWAVEPKLGRVAHGISHRVDRLKCLGNAIVPQVAYQILKVIAEIES